MTKVKLDFSMFHPLDHNPWDARCREFYGGWRTHLSNGWRYKWRDDLVDLVMSPVMKVLCPLGIHNLRVWHRREGFVALCGYCDYSRPARADEEFDLEGLDVE